MDLMCLLERLRFRLRMVWLGWTVKPVAGGAPDGDDDDDDSDDSDDSDDDSDSDSDSDDDSSDDDEDEDEEEDDSDLDTDGKPKKSAEEYRSELRKAERKGKKVDKRQKSEIDRLKKQLTAREAADASDQDKAVTAAREEGKKEAEEAAEKDRRADKLENAVIKLASKGVELGEGDDAKTVKFADKGALMLLKEAVDAGDIDSEDLFDNNGRVREDALTDELRDILTDEDWLVKGEAGSKNGGGSGSSDAGKGRSKKSGGGSVEDELKLIRQTGEK